MRKLITAGSIAAVSLTVAAVAWAQNPAPTASLEVSVAPTKVGTKKNPRSGRLELSAETNREAKGTASRIEIMVPKGALLKTTGLRSCSWLKLEDRGRAACPAASKAGSGEADALLNPYATEPAEIKFIVTVFNGGKLTAAEVARLREQSDTPSLYRVGRQNINFHLRSESPVVDQPLAGIITPVRGNRLYGQRLTIEIARNLQQPAPGVYSALQRLETSLAQKSGRRELFGLRDCPPSRELQMQLKLTFVPNPTPPGATTATAIDGARCSG